MAESRGGWLTYATNDGSIRNVQDVAFAGRLPGWLRAALRGIRVHRQLESELRHYGGGYVKTEVKIPGAGRADALDYAKKIVYEIKPRGSYAEGLKQGRRYADALSTGLSEEATPWSVVVIEYSF